MPMRVNMRVARSICSVRSGFALTFAVGCVLASGCGAANSSSTTRSAQSSQSANTASSFVSRVNGICTTINRAIDGLPRQRTASGRFSVAAWAYDTRTMLALAPRWAAQLAAVHPPAWAASHYGTLIRVNADQTSMVATMFVAATHGEVALLRSITRRLAPLITRYNRLAESLGLSVCAQNPTPQSSRKPPGTV